MTQEASPRDSAANVIRVVNTAEWLDRTNQSSDLKGCAEDKARLASIIWKAIGVVNVHPYGWLERFAYPMFLNSSRDPESAFLLVPTSDIRESAEFSDLADYFSVGNEVFSRIRGMRLDLSRLNRSQDVQVLPEWNEVSQALSRVVLSANDIVALGAQGVGRDMQKLKRSPDAELDPEFLIDASAAQPELEPHARYERAALAVRRIVSDEWWEGCGGTVGIAEHARYKANMARLIWGALGAGDLDEFPWLDGPAFSKYFGSSMRNNDFHLVGTSFERVARISDMYDFQTTRGEVMNGLPGSTLDHRKFGDLVWPLHSSLRN